MEAPCGGKRLRRERWKLGETRDWEGRRRGPKGHPGASDISGFLQTTLFTTCTLCPITPEPPWAAITQPTSESGDGRSGTRSTTPGRRASAGSRRRAPALTRSGQGPEVWRCPAEGSPEGDGPGRPIGQRRALMSPPAARPGPPGCQADLSCLPQRLPHVLQPSAYQRRLPALSTQLGQSTLPHVATRSYIPSSLPCVGSIIT